SRRPRGSRLPQPALGRPCNRSQPAVRRRGPGPRAPGAAGPRRRASGRAGHAWPSGPHVLPGRRPRRRDGLPGAAPAGEHEQRVVSERAGSRDAARDAAGGAVRAASPLPAADDGVGVLLDVPAGSALVPVAPLVVGLRALLSDTRPVTRDRSAATNERAGRRIAMASTNTLLGS